MGKCTLCQKNKPTPVVAKLGERWGPVCAKCARKLRKEETKQTVPSGAGYNEF